jgi:hypothetical protein
MRGVAWLLVALLMTAPASRAAAEVTVVFSAPERFTDASLHGGYGAHARAFALDAIARHLEALGARDLAPGQTLAIEVLDVDLAGRFEPWRAHDYDLRVLTGATWPRINVRYTLSENGRVLLSAQETVIDQYYLARPARASSDPLRYEKTMLDDWFRARFVARRAPPA